jgi:hypothetical protein
MELVLDGEEPDFELYEYLKGQNASRDGANRLLARMDARAGELRELVEDGPEDLKEAYSFLSKKQARVILGFYDEMLDHVNKFLDNKKIQRKPRKAKAPSKEKLLKHFRYQPEDKAMKLVSVDPSKIIGAVELWVFNTKYKYITVFRSSDPKGLQVHRSSITGYDEARSVSKRGGRSADKYVARVLSDTKPRLNKLMDEVKGDAMELQHRINENVVLLRVA